jgi:hypothetical protein
VHCRGCLHTCAYTSVTRNGMFYLVKKDPKLHQPSVYATVDAIVGCIKYDWLFETQEACTTVDFFTGSPLRRRRRVGPSTGILYY